eukprot:5192462-Amphidinium_carterae.1
MLCGFVQDECKTTVHGQQKYSIPAFIAWAQRTASETLRHKVLKIAWVYPAFGEMGTRFVSWGHKNCWLCGDKRGDPRRCTRCHHRPLSHCFVLVDGTGEFVCMFCRHSLPSAVRLSERPWVPSLLCMHEVPEGDPRDPGAQKEGFRGL